MKDREKCTVPRFPYNRLHERDFRRLLLQRQNYFSTPGDVQHASPARIQALTHLLNSKVAPKWINRLTTNVGRIS